MLRKKTQLLSFLVFIVLLLFFSIVGVVTIVAMCQSEEDRTRKQIPNVFKFFEVNKTSNKTTRGIMTILQSNYEDISTFQINDDSYALISKHGSEYECTGSCSCDGDRRSTVSNVFSRSIFYLVSAITTVVALEKAKDYFEDHCVKEFSDECDGDSIRSEVEKCVRPTDSFWPDNVIRTPRERYICYGFCLNNKRLMGSPEEAAMVVRKKCETIRTEEIVDCDPQGDCSELEAKNIFESKFLVPFCKENTQKMYPHKGLVIRWYIAPLCRGKPETGEQNPTIVCFK